MKIVQNVTMVQFITTYSHYILVLHRTTLIFHNEENDDYACHCLLGLPSAV